MKQPSLHPRFRGNLAWSAPMTLVLLTIIGLTATMPQFTWAQPQTPRASDLSQSPAADISPAGEHIAYMPFVPQHYCNEYPCLIYQDDFSNPSSGWPIQHSDYGKVEIHRDYENGTYHMNIENEWFTAVYAMAPNVKLPNNYIIQFRMRYDFSDYRADWGVVFGATGDPGAFYAATANRYGEDIYYAIRYISAAGKEDELKSGGAQKLLKASNDWRTVRVVREGDLISFESSKGGWTRIGATRDDRLNGGGMGFRIFTSELGAEAWFDDLYIWDLGPESAILSDLD